MITIISVVPKCWTPPNTHSGNFFFVREINVFFHIDKVASSWKSHFIYENRFFFDAYFVAVTWRRRERERKKTTVFAQTSSLWLVQYICMLLSCNKNRNKCPKLIHFWLSFFSETHHLLSFNEFACEWVNRNEAHFIWYVVWLCFCDLFDIYRYSNRNWMAHNES